LQLIDNDFILLLFGFGLADTFDKLLELFRKMTGCGSHLLIIGENMTEDE
jgi:hypothetical protein